MGVEISPRIHAAQFVQIVMPREGHGSRNAKNGVQSYGIGVMPREGHGSRNAKNGVQSYGIGVMPREGHGSRNIRLPGFRFIQTGHAPRGAWE